MLKAKSIEPINYKVSLNWITDRIGTEERTKNITDKDNFSEYYWEHPYSTRSKRMHLLNCRPFFSSLEYIK